jgi:hypothetical protein
MGYNSLYIIPNFGTLCWVILATPILWICSPLLSYVCSGSFAHLRLKINRMMFWNNWLGFFYETYLFLGVCVALNCWYFNFNTYGNAFNSLVSVIFGFVLLILPFFVGILYNLPESVR